MLILIRGLPGSGKSTLARGMMMNYVIDGYTCSHFESDMFFTDSNGVYKFDGDRIKEAHDWCLQQAKNCGSEIVIVSNIFTRLWEMQPYIDHFGQRDTTEYICQENFGSIHPVPQHVIENMRMRFEHR